MRMLLGPDDLLTAGDLDDDDLLEAYPWPEPTDPDASGRPYVRAMMVTTLDGASAGPDGLSGTISSGVDRQVFRAVRRLADAVLVGAETIRAEGYGAMRAHPDDAARRAAAGLSEAPRLAIVSGSLTLPWDSELFSDSTHRPLVLTGPDPDADALATARDHAEVVRAPVGASGDDPEVLLDALAERGLRRVVCEGGPRLLERMVAAGAVDEADITLSPAFAGHGHVQPTDGLPEIAAFRLAHVLHAEGFLMNRYLHSGQR